MGAAGALMKGKVAHARHPYRRGYRPSRQCRMLGSGHGDEPPYFPNSWGVPLSDTGAVANHARCEAAFHGARVPIKLSRLGCPRKWRISLTRLQEAALAHVVPDKVVRAYKRTTFLEMRRELMEAWAQFLASSADRARATP